MRAGDFVCLAYGSGNRDERQYPNPDVYDIRRKPRGHLGFGGGVHACLGTAIARLAVKIAFEEFHQVVPDVPARAGAAGVDAVVDLPQPAAAGPGGSSERREPMTQITFIEPSGTATVLDVPDGWSLMQARHHQRRRRHRRRVRRLLRLRDLPLLRRRAADWPCCRRRRRTSSTCWPTSPPSAGRTAGWPARSRPRPRWTAARSRCRSARNERRKPLR